MQNHDVVNPNVLCPWRCSTFCRDASKYPINIMIQHMLLKVLLPICSDLKEYNKTQTCSVCYLCKEKEYSQISIGQSNKM